jgi:hypothetical protein
MTFFHVLYWMGMLCVGAVAVTFAYDAIRAAAREAGPPSRLAPPAGIEPTSSA